METFLHTLFERQVIQHPNGIALKFQQEQISYQELNSKSNRLAHHLIDTGVKPSDKVALLLERSIEMMIGILGVLKSGAAYAPIGTKTPKDRYRFLIEDLGNPCMVTSKRNHDIVKDQAKVIYIEDVQTEGIENPEIDCDESLPAVVLYTSGSTGYPKGVLLSHRSLVNRIVWDGEAYGHTAKDIVLQHASYTFDFSILEMFMALANGGKLILARPDFYYESFYLIDLIQQEQITKMGLGPSLIKSYINLPAFEQCTSLKQVFLGGETLPYNLQNLFHEKSKAELINIYGPTEASISVLNWHCIRNHESKTVPIGYPVANAIIHLLTDDMKPVADGEVGEICIAGPGVGIGYLNRPELTQNRFVPNPFATKVKGLMYKTGDLGKKLQSGAYQFMGRKDNQVKIRGLRVELEEIEHFLNLDKNISSSVVSKVKMEGGIEKLVAYLILVANCEIDIEELKKTLSDKLPDYMVPGLFVGLDKFPMTAHGKVNRNALPYPDKLTLLSNRKFKEAKSDTQKKLVGIYERVLQIKPIGLSDPFFDLGGDSIGLVEVQHHIEQEFGITIAIASLSNAPTIVDLEKLISEHTNKNRGKEKVCLARPGKKSPILFVNPIIGTIDYSKNISEHLNRDHPIVVTMPYETSDNKAPRSIEEIARQYVAALEHQFNFQEYFICGFSIGGLVALEMATILIKKGKAINNLVFIDTVSPKEFSDAYSCRFLFLKKSRFYLRKLVASKPYKRKELRGFLKDSCSYYLKKGKNRPQQHDGSKGGKHHSKKPGRFTRQENINEMISVTMNYVPKPYGKDAVLISAKENPQENIYYKPENKGSIDYWKNEIFSNLSVYEIPSHHVALLESPNNKLVANIINEHLLLAENNMG